MINITGALYTYGGSGAWRTLCGWVYTYDTDHERHLAGCARCRNHVILLNNLFAGKPVAESQAGDFDLIQWFMENDRKYLSMQDKVAAFRRIFDVSKKRGKQDAGGIE